MGIGRVRALARAAVVAALVAGSFVLGTATAHAAPPVVPQSAPDLTVSIPAGSGEGETLPLGTGNEADFGVVISSDVDTPASTVTITLPQGLVVDLDFGIYRDDGNGDDERKLKCHEVGQQVTCALGALQAGVGVFVDIPLQPTAGAAGGTVGIFTVRARPDSGPDANPDDNDVQGSIRFLGTAHLRVHIHAARRRVTIGRSTKVTVTVTNEGPQPAPAALGFLGLEEFTDAHFTVTGFSGRSLVPSDELATQARRHARVAQARRLEHRYRTAARRAGDLPPLLFWNAGDIAPGATAHAVLTLHADSRGTGTVFAYAFSDAGDPACDTDDLDPDGFGAPPGCAGFDELAVHAVRPAAAPSDSHDDPIAATGARPAELSEVGLLAVLAGVALVALGRRRRCR